MKSIKQDLVDFVQSTPVRCSGDINFQHFVLANGTEHIRHPDPQRFFTRHGATGQCFKNAFLLVSEFRNELLYAEGYVRTSNSPMLILHAWALKAKGEYIDPTLPDGIDYFGVPFDFEYVTGIVFRDEEFTGVILNHRNNCPLLSGKATNWRPKVMLITNPPSPPPLPPSLS